MAVEVWFVNGQSVKLDIEMSEASDAIGDAAVGRGNVDYFPQPGVAVVWRHVTHVTATPERQRDRTGQGGHPACEQARKR